MSKEFTVDGTGNIVRPGDRVVVRAINLNGPHGPGRLLEIYGEAHVQVLCDGSPEPAVVSIAAIMREDDKERAGDLPLWHYR